MEPNQEREEAEELMDLMGRRERPLDLTDVVSVLRNEVEKIEFQEDFGFDSFRIIVPDEAGKQGKFVISVNTEYAPSRQVESIIQEVAAIQYRYSCGEILPLDDSKRSLLESITEDILATACRFCKEYPGFVSRLEETLEQARSVYGKRFVWNKVFLEKLTVRWVE